MNFRSCSEAGKTSGGGRGGLGEQERQLQLVAVLNTYGELCSSHPVSNNYLPFTGRADAVVLSHLTQPALSTLHQNNAYCIVPIVGHEWKPQGKPAFI